MNTTLLTRLDGIESRFEEVSTLITDPAVIADMKRYVRLNKEYKELERLTAATRRYRTLLGNLDEARMLLDTETDPEMRQMAHDQIDEANAQLPALEEEIKLLLIPADPEDSKNAIVEIRGGTGATRLPSSQATSSRCTPNIASRRGGRWLSPAAARAPWVASRR